MFFGNTIGATTVDSTDSALGGIKIIFGSGTTGGVVVTVVVVVVFYIREPLARG